MAKYECRVATRSQMKLSDIWQIYIHSNERWAAKVDFHQHLAFLVHHRSDCNRPYSDVCRRYDSKVWLPGLDQESRMNNTIHTSYISCVCIIWLNDIVIRFETRRASHRQTNTITITNLNVNLHIYRLMAYHSCPPHTHTHSHPHSINKSNLI